MKALMIGGTGVISTSVSQLALAQGWDVTLLNRGSRSSEVPGARQLIADMNDEAAVRVALAEETYDVVADFIAFRPEQVERDIRLFSGKTHQYIFLHNLTPPTNLDYNNSDDYESTDYKLQNGANTNGTCIT